jgi:dTDP-4-amino-4,6-dideoxygalactose transaminase
MAVLGEPSPTPAAAAAPIPDAGAGLAVDGGPPTHPGPWPQWPQPTEADERAVQEVVRSGAWCSAARGAAVVRAFEEAFAALHAPPPAAPPSPLDGGAPPAPLQAVAVTSGTSALILALEAAGVGPGDDVIVPPYTFIATASAGVFLGAVPVFADVDPRTLCLDPAAVDAAWTPRTKAVIPVHFGGCPADLPALAGICRDRGAALIEDACQAPGAAWLGRPVGSWGTFGCFSFQESKNLSAGEGGAVTGRGAEIEAVWSLHNVGRRRGGAWYGHERIGQNLRMTGLQAALLHSQLARFGEQCGRRAAAASRLAAHTGAIPGIEPLVPPAEVTAHAWHLFPFRYHPAAFGGRSRAEFLRALAAEGVPASAGYTLLADNAALYRRAKANAALAGAPEPRFAEARLPVAREAAENCCWLFQALLLAEDEDLDAIPRAMDRIRRAWA